MLLLLLITIFAKISNLSAYTVNIDKLRKQLNELYASMPENERPVVEIDYPPPWSRNVSEKFKKYCKRYADTEKKFSHDVLEFIEKIRRIKTLISKYNADFTLYQNEIGQHFLPLIEIENTLLHHDSAVVKNEPATEIEHQDHFTNLLAGKLIGFRQKISQLKKCHNDYKIFLKEIPKIKSFIQVDETYMNSVKKSHPEYVNNVVHNKWFTDERSCARRGTLRLDITGHVSARRALHQIKIHYQQYDNFEKQKIFCRIGSPIDTTQKLLEETRKLANEIDSVLSQHAITYSNEIKSVYEGIKADDSLKNLRNLENSLKIQLNDLNDKTLSSMDLLTLQMINDQISIVEPILDNNRGHLPVDIIDSLQSKIDSLNGYITTRNRIDETNTENGQKKRDIVEKILEATNSLKSLEIQNTDSIGVHEELTSIDNIMTADLKLTVGNIKTITFKMAELKFKAKTKLAEYQKLKSSPQLASLEEQHNFSSNISQLDHHLKQTSNQLNQLMNEFEQTKKEIKKIVTDQLPKAINAANQQHLTQKLSFEDPAEKLTEAFNILDTTEKSTPLLESTQNSMNIRLTTLITDLDNYSAQMEKVKLEYNNFVISTKSHSSKLLHSIAVREFDRVVKLNEIIENKIKIDKTTATSFDKDKDAILTDINSVKATVARLKSSVEKATKETHDIKKAKTDLNKYISEIPKKFKQKVAELMKNLNININADLLLAQTKTARSNMGAIKTTQSNTLDTIDKLESNLGNYSNDINELEELKGKATSSVNLKREELTQLISKAAQTYLDTTKLQDYSTKQYNMLEYSRKSKISEVERTFTTNNAKIESEKQKVLTQKAMSKDFYEVAKNFYDKKYNVNLKNYEGEYQKINDKYDNLLNGLNTEKSSNQRGESQLIQTLDGFQAEEVKKYETHFTLLKELLNSIKSSFEVIEDSTDDENYDALVTEGRNVLSSYVKMKEITDQYSSHIETTILAVTNVKSSESSYDRYSSEMAEIVNQAKIMMKKYEDALQAEYIRVNKIEFKDAENQEFFDSAERKFNFIEKILLATPNNVDTNQYSVLASEIQKSAEKLVDLEAEYAKLNVKLIVAKFYPQIPGVIEHLTSIEVELNRNIKLTTDTYDELGALEDKFSSEKNSFSLSYNELNKLKKKYDLLIRHILDLSNDKKADENEVTSKIEKFKKDKSDLLTAIKQETLALKQFFKNLRVKKIEHDQLLSTVTSTAHSLASLKRDSDSGLTNLKSQNEALTTQLKKSMPKLDKIENISLITTTISDKSMLYIKGYPSKLESLRNGSIKTIDDALNSLAQVKSLTLRDKNKLEEKLVEFSSYYEVDRDTLSKDIFEIINSQNERLSTNENHCNKYIEYSNNQKHQIIEGYELLNDFYENNSKKVFSELTRLRTDMDCCMKVMNGEECGIANPKDFNQCVSYVEAFDIDYQVKSTDDFIDRLKITLDSLKLKIENDELGVEALNNLSTDSEILTEKITQLEEFFKSEFKSSKIAAVKKQLLEIETQFSENDLVVTSSTSSISQRKNLINSKLNDYNEQIRSHEKKVVESKTKFFELSSNAEVLKKSIEKEAKNTHIIQEINKKPSIANTISNYAVSLGADEGLIRKSKEYMRTYSDKLEILIGTFESNSSKHTKLKHKINDVHSRINDLESNEKLNQKQMVLQKTGEIQSYLNKKYSEITLTLSWIVIDEKKLEEFSRTVDTEYDNLLGQIKKSTHQINDHMTNANRLLKKLKSLKESSSTINIVLNNLSSMKDELQIFQDKLQSKKKKSSQDIELIKNKLTENIKSKINLLDTEKKHIDSKINEYNDSFNELFNQANEKSTDVPVEIAKKNDEFLTLKISMQSEYDDKKATIDNYERNGNLHFDNQASFFNDKYLDLKSLSDHKISKIDSLNSEITKLNVANQPALTQHKYDSLISLVKDFLAKNDEVSFVVEEFNEDVDTKTKKFTAETEKHIQNEILKNKKTLTALLTDENNKKDAEVTKVKVDENNTLVNEISPPDSSDQLEMKILAGENKKLHAKDYFKLIVTAASVAVIFIFIAGTNMWYRAKRKKEIYRKCEDVYTSVTY